jgi:TPR repeat protein
MRPGNWLLAAAILGLAAPGLAQTVNIPGLGRIRIPLPPILRERGRADSRPRPVASAEPATNPDGSARCNARVDYSNSVRFRIIEAKFTDRPSLTGFQGMASGGVKGFWVVDYEATADVGRPYSFSVEFAGSGARDSAGRAWGAMRNPRSEGSLTPAGQPTRGQATFISYESDGSGIATMAPKFSGWVTAPGRGVTDSYNRQLDLRLPPIPANCTDEPAAASRVATGGGTPGLIRPHQLPLQGISKVNAAAGTVREAVQIGFIWSYGEGVFPDFAQGLAWYREAERRQAAQRDFSMQNEIRLMLGYYAESRVGSLFNQGLAALARNSWDESLYFFGRAAEIGNAQAMAALGYVYGEGRLNPRMEVYWCRKAFLASRSSAIPHDRDAVNHFCPLAAFDDLMTAQERRSNPASIARAAAESAAVRREHDAMVALGRRWMREAMIDGLTSPGPGGGGGGGGGGASSAGKDNYSGMHAPPISALYGNCPGGAFYGC